MLAIVPVQYHRDIEWNRFARRHNASLSLRAEVCATVIELVHPGNLGMLPPSPMYLVHKAYHMDLISYNEVQKCEACDFNYYGRRW